MSKEIAQVHVGSSMATTVFSDATSFETAQRMAKALMSASMLPESFRGNIGDTLIIIELGQRLGASPFMVAQNVDVIYGRPAMRAQFVIACLNASGRFSPLDFRFTGTEGTDDWACQAFATAKSSGIEVSGPKISIALAKKEGWYSKKGSKWQTMPELMLRYRAGAWFGRLHAPDLLLGMQTAEEAVDVIDVRQQVDGSFAADDKAAEAAAILENVNEPAPIAEGLISKEEVLAIVKKAKAVDDLLPDSLGNLDHLNDADFTEVDAVIHEKLEALKQAEEKANA